MNFASPRLVNSMASPLFCFENGFCLSQKLRYRAVFSKQQRGPDRQ
jgi:hypothetical protein